MTRARKNTPKGRHSAAVGPIEAFLERNDPRPLADLLRGRKPIPAAVRRFLAKLIMGEARRRPGRPSGPNPHEIPELALLNDSDVAERLLKLQNEKKLTLGMAKEELARRGRASYGKRSVRSIDRALQRVRRAHGIPPKKRLFRRVKLG